MFYNIFSTSCIASFWLSFLLSFCTSLPLVSSCCLGDSILAPFHIWANMALSSQPHCTQLPIHESPASNQWLTVVVSSACSCHHTDLCRSLLLYKPMITQNYCTLFIFALFSIYQLRPYLEFFKPCNTFWKSKLFYERLNNTSAPIGVWR